MTRVARWVALVLLALVAGCGGGGGAAPADSVAPLASSFLRTLSRLLTPSC